MAERLLTAAAILPGLLVALAVVAVTRGASVVPAARWLDRRRGGVAVARRPVPVPRSLALWLALRLERAGWRESPDRFLALAALVMAACALSGAAAGSLGDGGSAIVAGAAGGAIGAGIAARALTAAVARRRRRLLAHLAPTLELACLELSAGSSAAVALAAVTRRTGGDLSRELRQVLAASAVASSDPLEVRLRRLGERLDLPPLAALAAVMATSRDYGSGVLHGVHAIAVDLRRAQRRELIATSRSALTRVLVPAAVGVLLPFMAILLFPAVTSLAANLR